MAKEAWPTKEVIEASKEVVCLAINRFGEKTNGRLPPSDWATRLNVMGYPQFRFLDGWARPLERYNSDPSPRTRERLVMAFAEAVRVMPSDLVPPSVRLPDSIMKTVPPDLKEKVLDPDCMARTAAWLACLERVKLNSSQLLDLFRAEEDPLIRIAVLERLDGDLEDQHGRTVLELAMEEGNDYAREKAFALLKARKGPFAAKLTARAINMVLDGKSHCDNPGNVLNMAALAAEELHALNLVPALSRLLEERGWNYSATRCAVSALIAIGKHHGMGHVEEALDRAEATEGKMPANVRSLLDQVNSER